MTDKKKSSVNRRILQIAIPSIISNITVPLLGLIDVTIVGHLGSPAYIGAIAVGGMLFNIIYWIFGFLRMGTSGMTSQAYGQHDLNEITRLLLRSVGVGLFIALLGLEGAGIVVHPADGGTIVSLGNITSGAGLLAIIGIVITGILVAKNIKGALFLGMIITAIIGIPMGVIELPNKIFSMPPSISSTFMQFELHNIFSWDMVIVLFTLLFMDMFDTIGTLVGVATKANMLDKDGKVPNIKKALFADAIGTTMGACLGTSTVSTFVESASGVAEGGRTGLTAVSTAFMFFLSLFLSPIFGVITSAVTASVLVIVGLFMIENIKELNLEDYTEAIPAFLTIIMMPFAYSISDGIVFGVVSYILLKLFTGRWKEISWTTVVVGIVFVLKFVFI